MARRIIQNFYGRKAFLITTEGGSADVLSRTLNKFGLATEYPSIVDGQVNLVAEALHADRDVLFVDGDLNCSISFGAEQRRCSPVPVIGVVGAEAPGRLKALINLGATAFIRKPIHGGAVYTAVFVGLNQFLQRRDLEAQIEEHQDRRKRRRVVVKAIIHLMQRDGVDDDEAYSVLRKESMRARRSLEDHCELLIHELLPVEMSRIGSLLAADKH